MLSLPRPLVQSLVREVRSRKLCSIAEKIKIKRFGDLPLYLMGFPGGSDGKESACNVGDLGLIPGLGRFPGEGNDYPLQYSGLENPRDGEPGGLPSMGSHRVGHN